MSKGDVILCCLLTAFATTFVVSVIWETTTVATWKGYARDGGTNIFYNDEGYRVEENFNGVFSTQIFRKYKREAGEFWLKK